MIARKKCVENPNEIIVLSFLFKSLSPTYYTFSWYHVDYNWRLGSPIGIASEWFENTKG